MSTQSDFCDDEVDLRDLFASVWRGKYWIVGAGFIAGLMAVLLVLRMPNIYTAEVILLPAADANHGSASKLAGNFGGLANLAGINLSSGGVDISTIAIETLKSRAFLKDFINRHEMLVPLMATKGWSFESESWIIDPEIYDKKTRKWVRKVDGNKTPQPSYLEAYNAFNKNITINQDKKTQLITLVVQSTSPLYAKVWAEKLVEDANNYLCKKDVEQAEKSIAYLKKQLENTSVAQMQSILYQLIEEQTKIIMLASVRDGYAFDVIDPPVIPEEKSGPKRTATIILAVLGSMVMCAFSILFLSGIKKAEHNRGKN